MSMIISESIVDTKPLLLRYRMNTRSGLSARESELTLMAATDDICFAQVLASYDSTIGRQISLPSVESVRGILHMQRITYSNPWELLVAIPGAAVSTVAFIEAILLLRTKRRRAEADLMLAQATAARAESSDAKKAAAEARQAEASARKAEADARIAWADVRLREETLDCTIQEKIRSFSRSQSSSEADSGHYRHAALASLRSKQNELVDDAMEAITALHSFQIDHEDILARALLHGGDQKAVMDAVFDAPPPDPDPLLRHHEELRLQLKNAANNVRLLMSYARLDNIDRQAEAISEDSPEP